MNISTTELADVLKRRDVSTIYYFHTDHYEPWSLGLNETTARGVERFAEMSLASPFARRMSLFYSAFVPYNLDRSEQQRAVGHRVRGDRVVFHPRTEIQEELARKVIRPLFQPDAHELHLHVHHEFWTRNELHFDTEVSKWVNANSNAQMDRDRLDLFFTLCREIIGRELGQRFDRWAFIHGNWALAASDPLICKIENELGMIMRHGGFGDFSFPAGRGYCDPKLQLPFTCRPIEGKRPYDDPASDPRPLSESSGVLTPDRFFIWNSPIKAQFSSLDYYSEPNRELFKEPVRILSEWLGDLVVFGSDLYLKTHAHSMKWEYEIFKPDSRIPHFFPDIVKIFEELLRVCDEAGVEFRLATVNEIMVNLEALDAGRTPDPTTLRPTFGPALDESVPRQQALREPRAPPVLKRPTAPGGLGQGAVMSMVEAQGSTALRARSSGNHQQREIGHLRPRNHSEPGSSSLADHADDGGPVEIELFKREFLELQREWMTAEGTGFGEDALYASKTDRGAVLEPYETAMARAIAEAFDRTTTSIVEVGSGYGALALLLGQYGFGVESYEGDRRRAAASAWHRKQYAVRHPGSTNSVSFVPGYFPDALAPVLSGGKGRCVCIVTNVTCTYTATNQERILGELGRFDELILDLGRFGVNCDQQAERDALRADIALRGFEAMERLYFAAPNEYWRFRKMPPQPSAAIADSTPKTSVGVTAGPVIAVQDKRAPLFPVFGDRRLDACPVCAGGNVDQIWRIPLAPSRESATLSDGHYSHLPTLRVPSAVYCFDFCADCRSIYLNPVDGRRKANYRTAEQDIRTMRSGAPWQRYEQLFDQFANWIPKDAGVMIDAACGIGQYLEVARKRAPDRWLRLIGLELSEPYVHHMRRRNLEAHVLDLDTQSLDSIAAPGSVDVVIFCDAFQHVEDPLEVIRKLLRTLRPGGRLFFTAPRYGPEVQAAPTPGAPIYVAAELVDQLSQRLGCQVADVATTSMRYDVVLEK